METRLSTQEVARLYGKDERTIRRWAKSGKIQAASFLNEFNSPEYLFPLDALDASILGLGLAAGILAPIPLPIVHRFQPPGDFLPLLGGVVIQRPAGLPL